MPSADLPEFFQEDLELESKWWWGGEHYQKTADAWLCNLDSNREQVMKLFYRVYGRDHSEQWFNRWRIFFLACSELFGFRQGREWGVSHYRFSKKHNGNGCHGPE